MKNNTEELTCLNRVELRGTVGAVRIQEIEGQRIARVSLVTNYAFRDKDSCPVIESTWHNITLFEGKKITCLDSIAKGTCLSITGRIRSQRYTTASGEEKIQMEILATEAQVLPKEAQIQFEN